MNNRHPNEPERRGGLFLLLAATAVLLFAGLGLRDPWPADEPRFALIARDMALNGNWLFPSVGGVLYPDKPPLFFWLVAVIYQVTGSLRAAFLLPGVLAGLGTMLLVTDLARRLWGRETALWCGATLLAVVQFPLQMKAGQIDGLLCFWTTLGLYGFSRHMLLGPDWRWYALGGLASGLGVITKGVGFLPYLILIPFVLAARGGWPVAVHTWRDFRWLLAPAATLLAILAWLLPMLAATTGGSDPAMTAYRDDILFHQTVTRYANPWGHLKPVWYLFTNAVPWLWFPASFALPWLVPMWRQDLATRRAPVLLLGGWILLVLLFFSLSEGKRSVYIFPAVPALALVAGYHAKAVVERRAFRRLLTGSVALPGLVLLAVGGCLLLAPRIAERWLAGLPSVFNLAMAAVVTGALMLVALTAFRRARIPFRSMFAMAIFWLGASLLVAPAINDVRSGRALMGELAAQIEDDAQVGFVGWPEQFLLQWPRPVTHFGYRRGDRLGEVRDAARWLSASPDRRILLPGRWLFPCFDASLVKTIGRAHRRDWVMADRSGLTASCRTPGADSPSVSFRYAPPGESERSGAVTPAG